MRYYLVHQRAPEFKVTKGRIEEFLSYVLRIPLNMLVFERLSERPQVWKHSCLLSGVIVLPSNHVVYGDGVSVFVAICPLCHKVLYFYNG